MKVFLVGFMCSGKSTLGRLLSSRLRLPFYDLDEEIVKREGLTVPQIFQKKGERYFRALELKVLRKLSRLPKGVFSTGGGLGANPKALALMKKEGFVLYLEVDFSTFVRRCLNSKERPLLGKSLLSLRGLYERRKRIYGRAHLRLKGEKSPRLLAEEALQFLKGTPFVGEEGTA